MSELFAAITRIQELEKEIVELRKRAEDAEYSAKALRTNNKELKTKNKTDLATFTTQANPSQIFETRLEVADYGDDVADSYFHAELVERFKRELADHLIREGYIKNMIVENEYRPHTRTTEYRLTANMNITK